MIELLERKGDVAISAPDEISALAYCVGASMRGFKSMTATSGPGFALMIETVQYALMTETPVVIAVVQRLGPSTGGATQGAQGDILLAEFCTSGGYTIPVLCPSTTPQCYELSMLAFSWAEMLRTPVILLSDKEVAMTSERVDTFRLREPPVVARPVLSSGPKSEKSPDTYGFSRSFDVPLFFPVGSECKVTATGSAHNKQGDLKKNDPETLQVLVHLEEKIRHRREELSLVIEDSQPLAQTLVISFGITARTMGQAVKDARKKGKRVFSVNVLSLFPIPERRLLDVARPASRIVIAEENLNGQYRSLLSHLFKDKEVVGVNKIGSMITPEEIENEIL
jgi:2-oxoglutarate ferredoxin oxidoreductase subunit alpha